MAGIEKSLAIQKSYENLQSQSRMKNFRLAIFSYFSIEKSLQILYLPGSFNRWSLKMYLILAMSLFGTTLFARNGEEDVPNNFIEYIDMFYMVSTSNGKVVEAKYDEAQQFCRKHQGRIPSIEELVAIQEAIKANFSNAGCVWSSSLNNHKVYSIKIWSYYELNESGNGNGLGNPNARACRTVCISYNNKYKEYIRAKFEALEPESKKIEKTIFEKYNLKLAPWDRGILSPDQYDYNAYLNAFIVKAEQEKLGRVFFPKEAVFYISRSLGMLDFNPDHPSDYTEFSSSTGDIELFIKYLKTYVSDQSTNNKIKARYDLILDLILEREMALKQRNIKVSAKLYSFPDLGGLNRLKIKLGLENKLLKGLLEAERASIRLGDNRPNIVLLPNADERGKVYNWEKDKQNFVFDSNLNSPSFKKVMLAIDSLDKNKTNQAIQEYIDKTE